MKISKLFLAIPFLFLSACELPDTEGLNKTPKITSEMKERLVEVERIEKVKAGKDDLEDVENYNHLSPIPDKVWAGGKLFGENGNNSEITDYVYLKLNALREVLPTKGLDQNFEPIPFTPEELAQVRVQKMGVLYGLMIISAYMQDSKIQDLIQVYIKGNHNRQSTALAILAMRAFFIRELLLKESFKIDTAKPETLYNSGAMKEAIVWLNKLDAVSNLELPQHLKIQVSVMDKTGNNLIAFEEVHNHEARLLTAQMWQTALEKAERGMSDFTAQSAGAIDQAELEAQRYYLGQIKAKVDSWAQKLQ